MTIRFRSTAEGRPAAEATDPSDTAFAQFLTEEAHLPHYAAWLAAAPTGTAATGNAYAVTIGADAVTIEHLHLRQAPLVIPRERFTTVMADWARFVGAQP